MSKRRRHHLSPHMASNMYYYCHWCVERVPDTNLVLDTDKERETERERELQRMSPDLLSLEPWCWWCKERGQDGPPSPMGRRRRREKAEEGRIKPGIAAAPLPFLPAAPRSTQRKEEGEDDTKVLR